MKVIGSCHCGQITYDAEVDPATVRISHGTDCQKLTGTVWRAGISRLPGTFELMGGTPKIYIKTVESGNKRAHAFCPECGTPIYSTRPDPNLSAYGLGSADWINMESLAHPGDSKGYTRHCPDRWISARSKRLSGGDSI